MKYELAKTKNVRKFLTVVNELRNRPMGVEGMGILWGAPGEGKTTILAYATNQFNGIFIRARRSWTMTSLLESIVTEMGGTISGRRSKMEDWIERKLMESREERIILVDEADYLFSGRNMAKNDMLDVLRDIYDQTSTPVILAGMENIARQLQEVEKFGRRITSWVEFKGIDLDDARIVADTLCEVAVADDLLEHLHKECKASIGNIVPGLSKIESFGKTNGRDTVTLADWGDRPLYFAQPKFRKRG